jgi:hypothetical protein
MNCPTPNHLSSSLKHNSNNSFTSLPTTSPIDAIAFIGEVYLEGIV